jgi:hypothetical protein
VSTSEQTTAARSTAKPRFIPGEFAWLIWSNEHAAWWGPNTWGYTTDITTAGRYSFAEAVGICARAGKSQLGAPEEIMTPAPEAIEADSHP